MERRSQSAECARPGTQQRHYLQSSSHLTGRGATATHYRFWTERPFEDHAPVFAGCSNVPSLPIENLEPGHEVRIFISAANDGGESSLSTTVVGISLAQAA